MGYESETWSLVLWGRNLTDEDVETRGFRFGNDPRDGYTTHTYVQLGEPRVVGLTGRYKFEEISDDTDDRNQFIPEQRELYSAY